MATDPEEKVEPTEELLQELLNTFDEAQRDLTPNSDYYNANYRPEAVGVGTPPELRKLMSRVGWARLYVDALTERLDLEGFRMAGNSEADETLWQWWQSNFLDVDSTLGHTEALIHGRAYITVSAPDPENQFGVDPEMPIIRVESPTALYAEVDPLTRRVVKAVRPMAADSSGQVSQATMYLPDSTTYWVKDGGNWTQGEGSITHGLGRVPIVPLTYRTSLSDLEGSSIIIPEIRDAMDHASRTMMNMSSATELMGAPLRLIFGAVLDDMKSGGANAGTAFEAYYARILAFEEPQGKAEQLQAAELQNFVNAMQELTRQVAGYTGLPPQYLGFSSDNPASAEAIRASEARLVKTCERLCKMFGAAWEEAMRIGMLVMGTEISSEAYRMETIWRDPATPTFAAKADAVTKLYGNGQGVIPLERARMDLGYSVEERNQMLEWDKDNPVNQLGSLYGAKPVKEDEPVEPEPVPEEAA